MSLQPAFPSPYADPKITFRNPPSFVETPVPAFPTPASTGPVTVYNLAGTNFKPNNAGSPAQPIAPPAWKLGRDPYAIGGAAGQPQFSNQA